jgi:hypothetical protein
MRDASEGTNAPINDPRVNKLEHIYARLSAEQPNELLQCLLVASAEGEAMTRVLEQTLLCHVSEELLEE